MENKKGQLIWNSGSLFNPFAVSFPLMEKPGSWFTPVKCLKNTFERVILYIKMQVNYLHLYLKCSSSSGVFHTFYKYKSTTWFLHNRNIGRKWVNSFSIPQSPCSIDAISFLLLLLTVYLNYSFILEFIYK